MRMKKMMKKLILSIAVLMLAVSTTVAQPTATNLGVSDANGTQGTFVLVPVNITNIQNGPIAGIIFTLNFNSSVINLNKTRVTLGDLTSSWEPPSVNPTTGIIAINYAGSGTEIPNGTSGSVVILNFSVIGSPGATSSMTISGIQLSDPDGNVGFTTPAKNGNFTVSGGPTPGAIAGTVTNASSGAGIPSADIFLDNVDTTINTNATGYYTISNVAAGNHAVMAVASGFNNGTTNVTVTGGATATANIALTPISGGTVISIAANRTNVSIVTSPITPTPVLFTVMLNNTPASGATVTLSGAATGSGTTAADGTIVFMISPTRNGTITATATLAGNTATTTLTTKGDVNGDGKVDIVDALFIAQYTVGSRTLSPNTLVFADVNGDGKVDIVDALFIAQATVGISDRPVPKAGN
jgi:hypothetical protein